MRIQNDGPSKGQLENTSQTSAARRPDLYSVHPGSASSRQVGLDRVDLSDLAKTAASALDHAKGQMDARIEELTKLYRAGQISVNADSLASAIVDTDSKALDLNLDK